MYTGLEKTNPAEIAIADNKRIAKSDFKGKNSVEIVTLENTGTRINVAGNIIYYLDNSESKDIQVIFNGLKLMKIYPFKKYY